MTVDFEINGAACQARGVDISLHGLYVEFRDEIPPNKRVKASFLLPTISSKKIEVSGRIAWVNQGFPRQNMGLAQGFGIEFHSIDMAAVDIVKAYLDKN